ncbi:MAG TPA: UDP-glucose/GDP-mannose dehydrogenase family protein [Symbiobacteriaceae bacterium]|nr:UDP-glucose/GDP-mannose dehydrogenase family protein [Symbiobacteriaceae bacterium]
MKIAIAGAGYVGLTSAVCFCELGHRVSLIEIDPGRLGDLQAGHSPIFEPGVPELLLAHRQSGALTVTDSLQAAVDGAGALFVCVGTPPRASGAPDLTALRHLIGQIGQVELSPDLVVVLKSTVPPGTNRWARSALGLPNPVVSNPEFLREGTAIADFFQPDRIIVGGPDHEALLRVAGLYAPIEAPLLLTDWEEAELIKYATNGFLALKISYANEIASLAEAIGADGLQILTGLGLDHRVGPAFLKPGPGYGGSCLPKDLAALRWKARQQGVRLELLPAAERVNQRQRERLIDRLRAELGGLAGTRIAVWGLAFKAGTDDLRGAASATVIPALLQEGAEVRAHDFAALTAFEQLCPPEQCSGLRLTQKPLEALHEADALLLLTEWPAYAEIPPEAIQQAMRGDLVLDARNLLDGVAVRKVGLRYRGIGRGR